MAEIIWDTGGWYRVGRGKGFSFRATTDQVMEALDAGLPTCYAPYSLVMCQLVKVAEIPRGHAKPRGVYVEKGSIWEMEDLPKLCSPQQWQFFIYSRMLLDVDLGEHISPSVFCSFNGMIHLQHRGDPTSTLPSSDFGLVHRIATETFDHVVERVESVKILESLRRAFKPYRVKE